MSLHEIVVLVDEDDAKDSLIESQGTNGICHSEGYVAHPMRRDRRIVVHLVPLPTE